MCVCETHLQNTVLWEVCAVHCVPHFVFPIKAAQRVGTEVSRDFLLHEKKPDCYIFPDEHKDTPSHCHSAETFSSSSSIW